MAFVNRQEELARLEAWWEAPGGRLGMVWGRRRVGKTALVEQFARGKRAVFHTFAGRPAADELRLLSEGSAGVMTSGLRDLRGRPFTSWEDAFDSLAEAARVEPLLVVLDEFPEAASVTPELPGILRAVWDRLRSRSRLGVLLCGSAMRTMEAMQEERSPLYGRIDLALLLHPFAPHEAALMLPELDPDDRALVWGLLGGVPLYLEWWDQRRSIDQNLLELACTPAGRLLTEGDLALRGDALGDLGRQVMHAIAGGRTKHNEIADAVRADPTRTLERLVELRLVERLVPVTDDPRRTRRRTYRIADNFHAFWLACLERYRAEIDRGLGHSILPVLIDHLDDHLGARWEEAFRMHLRRLAQRGELGPGVVAVGPFWRSERRAPSPDDESPAEIDAVVLAGRSRSAVLVGEAKWTRQVDGRRIRDLLVRKATALPNVADTLMFAVAARDAVHNTDGLLTITAADIFTSDD